MGSRASGNTLDAELSVLQAMCQGTPERRVWADGIRLLAGYAFRDPLHQIVFEALRELATDDPAAIRGLLAQRVTVKGFPDVDLAPLFVPHCLSASQAIALMELLHTQRSAQET